jgi:HPt (histidine-containing phosphotransfer) domain-containing protein
VSSDGTSQELPGGEGAQFNPAALDMLRRVGDGSLLVRMIDIFLKNAPERLDSARAGVESGERRAVELASHSLKSSAGQLGGVALQHASAAVEKMAQTAEPDPVRQGIAVMQSEFDMMQEWLEQIRAESIATKGQPTGEQE